MHSTLPLLLAAVTLSPLARADKFWLESPDQQSAVEGSSPAVIEGVLIDQDDAFYHLRVAGGEIWLAKARVFRVDKDELSVAAIDQIEQSGAAALVAATAERLQAQREMRTRLPAPRAVAREASMSADAPLVEIEDPEMAVEFDPIIGRSMTIGVSDAELMRELSLAYAITHNHDYIKMLRVLRRLR